MTDHTPHPTDGTDDPQLRGLLTAAVPDDAPTLDAAGLARDARTARSRRRTATAVGGVLAVGATVAGVGLLGGQDPAARDDTLAATTAPYDAPACPATLPDLPDAASDLGSLEGVASVRLCPEVTEGTAVGGAVGPEALVTDLDGFAERVGELAGFDAGRCAAISVLNTRQSLQVTYADGATALVPTATCSPMTAAGHTVDGGDLATAFLAALDVQRDQLDYGRAFTGELGCDQMAVPSPARPGRERIVEALGCNDNTGTTTPIDATALSLLQDAWAAPGSTEGRMCTLVYTGIRVVAATDHGDTVVLNEACGTLLWAGWTPGEELDVPVTPAELGLTP